MHKSWREHQRHWARHFASVPKGFCRLFVLKLLNEHPKSGAELMNAIEERTSGQWRPSPGSIYPILKWLVDKELIKIESVVEGEKRYLLTEDGAEFLEEAKRLKKEFITRVHSQQSLIHQMFHDTQEDDVDTLLEEIYILANDKKDVSKDRVTAILEEAKNGLQRV